MTNGITGQVLGEASTDTSVATMSAGDLSPDGANAALMFVVGRRRLLRLALEDKCTTFADVEERCLAAARSFNLQCHMKNVN